MQLIERNTLFLGIIAELQDLRDRTKKQSERLYA